VLSFKESGTKRCAVVWSADGKKRISCEPAPYYPVELISGSPVARFAYLFRDVGGMHGETDARPYLILATKSRNSQYRPAARFAHAALPILEVVVTRNRDRPPVLLRSSGGTPQGFPVDRPGLI